jgi:hypothetical protein
MKRSFFKYLFVIGFIGTISHSCIKKNKYPVTPTIDYKSFVAFPGDSADLQISFTDGDGDIGLGDNKLTRNFYYTYYYKDTVSGDYLPYYTPSHDTLTVGYIISSHSSSYEGKSIKGDINIRIQQLRHDTWIKKVKYVFYLFDAAGNKSNVVTSPEITID